MTHSVARHLQVAVDEYDLAIRRFIPAYEAMLDAAVGAVALAGALERVLDLGAGTGALSARLLDRIPDAAVELWDVDPDMLASARVRLAGHAARATFRLGSFHDPLPRADAIMASLALHHVPTLDAKRALYHRIASALRPGGVFANADVMMPAEADRAQPLYDAWAAHMAASGIEGESARRHFAAWAGEDRYFPIDDELSLLEDAGLTSAIVFRAGPVTVLSGRRPG